MIRGTPPAPKKKIAAISKVKPPARPVKAVSAVWRWPGVEDYKNERLAYYQAELEKRGIPRTDFRLLTAQLIQESGSLSETTLGDHGCSIGILQYNACVHDHMSGKKYLATHPEWQDWRYQLKVMADMVSARYPVYQNDLTRIIVAHNWPAAARRGIVTGYYRKIQAKASILTSL